MNEQIKQFIKQATIYYPATKSSGEFSIFDKEKFAELIVKECAKQVDGWYDDFENECADRKILKHFEVEENESFDRTASHMAGEYVSYDDLKDEPVAHRFKWEEKEAWQYGDGYDATGAPNDPDYFAYEPLYTHPIGELTDEEIDNIFGICALNPTVTLTTEQCYWVVDAILKEAREK